MTDLSGNRLFDLVLLNTFIQVIDSGGYTAAAESLHLAQSTVSAHIKRLEQMTGFTLIDKRHRTPEPTDIGQRLLTHARQLVNLNTLAWNDMLDQRLEGVVRLGIPDDYLVYIHKILAGFEKNFPDVELQVHCGVSVNLLEKMSANMLDLAVTTRQPNTPGGKVLCREDTIWAAAVDYDAQRRLPLPLAVSTDSGCIFRQRGIEALDAAGRPWRIAYTSSSLSGLSAAVKAGLAVTILTPSMLTSGLRVLTQEDGMPGLPFTEIALHTQPEAEMNEAATQLMRTLQKQRFNLI
ncbi:LysR substrate-binding domain-containing protein [Pantoea sp. FN060301]|uniref:LysR substrate-binding domain-containing protein n=1 Tax=Pantoea sp. FN060301 TaxID=3420380 RepID=UPI003D16C14A